MTTETNENVIDFSAIEDFMSACGLAEDDMVQKIEISQAGVLCTLAFQVEGKAFTVGEGENASPLVFYKVLSINRPEDTDEHSHDDGTVHTHEDGELEES